MAHFYTDAGESRHEVYTKSKTAKSPTRPSTIADARKNGWLPSATTILNIIGAEGLMTWKLGQAIKFARQVPLEATDVEAILHANRMMAIELETASSAGTALHAELEEAVSKGIGSTTTAQHWKRMFVLADVVEILHSELMMASRSLGYAGTGDILGVNSKGQLVVFDLKTKDTKGKVESKKTYRNEKYELQLGCYANLAKRTPCPMIERAIKNGVVSCIAYVSRDEFIDTDERWIKVEMFDELQTMEAGITYDNLFNVWAWANKYDPRLEF